MVNTHMWDALCIHRLDTNKIMSIIKTEPSFCGSSDGPKCEKLYLASDWLPATYSCWLHTSKLC